VDLRFIQTLEFINNRLTNIERNIQKLDEKVEYSLALQKNHLIRVKNGENLSDSVILESLPYNDLSPQRAYEIYSNRDLDFLLLDVTRLGFETNTKLEGKIHIPFEDLNMRYAEIPNKTTPILVISEVGLRSIMACELLVKKGFYNVNNISGGYRYWAGSSSKTDSLSSFAA
tara:strand:- start:538 stop:1053 length:516 start_codon:yes stop_codon:yes gene_type:complete